MKDWIYVTNRVLDHGEIMLFDNFYRKPKKRNLFKDFVKVSVVIVYYGIKYLV